MNIKEGYLVRHPKRLEWGQGKVVARNGDIVEVFFEKTKQTKKLSLEYAHFTGVINSNLNDLLNEIFFPCFGFYKSYNKFTQAQIAEDGFTPIILDIKNGNMELIQTFQERFIKLISYFDKYFKNTVLCTPPPHAKNSISGIRIFSEQLINNYDFTDGLSILERTIDTEKNTFSRKSKEQQKETITINNEDLFENKAVCLLDDISTTGATLDACEDLLYENGAKIVIKFCLAKTVGAWDYENNKDTHKNFNDFYQEKIQFLNKIKGNKDLI